MPIIHCKSHDLIWLCEGVYSNNEVEDCELHKQ